MSCVNQTINNPMGNFLPFDDIEISPKVSLAEGWFEKVETTATVLRPAALNW